MWLTSSQDSARIYHYTCLTFLNGHSMNSAQEEKVGTRTLGRDRLYPEQITCGRPSLHGLSLATNFCDEMCHYSGPARTGRMPSRVCMPLEGMMCTQAGMLEPIFIPFPSIGANSLRRSRLFENIFEHSVFRLVAKP